MRWLSFFSVSVLCATQVMACTGILMQTQNQSAVNGRTVEFGVPLDMNLAVIPRNISFIGKTPLGKGMVYKSKYAAVGLYGFDDVVLMDGMNEKGLVAAAFYFSGYASYSKVTKDNQSKALSPADFPNWILTQFATVEEVKAALNSVVIAPTVLNGWGNAPPPMHYVVYDRAGKSIVIEPLEGTLKVYENELGVITNSPTFDWQLTNLSNYISLNPLNAAPNQLRSFSLAPFGQGTGMIGLPGDFTPPSRFVRAAFFSATAIPVASSDEAVDQTFHILNQFDIPLGAVRHKEAQTTGYDYTLLTCVKNPETLQYFYRSYQNQAIQFVDLRQFDLNAKSIKRMKIEGKQEKHDVSSMLK
jgi:choloylglycine hydrolase